MTGWLLTTLFGFVMNFLAGYGLKGFFFTNMLPQPRAIYTALLSYLICMGAAAFGGYIVLGTFSALFAFSFVAFLYAVPAFIHYMVLYYQFNLDWTVTDEEEQAIFDEQQALATRKIATITTSGSDISPTE